MKYVFVSAPLTSNTRSAYNVRRNMQLAEQTGAAIVNLGAVPYVPHLTWGPYFGLLAEPVALRACKQMLSQCDVMYQRAGDADLSKGCGLELEWARAFGLPVVNTLLELKDFLDQPVGET